MLLTKRKTNIWTELWIESYRIKLSAGINVTGILNKADDFVCDSLLLLVYFFYTVLYSFIYSLLNMYAYMYLYTRLAKMDAKLPIQNVPVFLPDCGGARSLGLSGSVRNLVDVNVGITRTIFIAKLPWLCWFPFCERILLRGWVRESDE